MSTDIPTSSPPATSSAPGAGSETPSGPGPGPAALPGDAGAQGLPDIEGLPEGAREVSPLFLMLLGTAIPVALVAVAASGGSTVVLILALLGMVVVGFATMVFMVRITTDPEHPHNASGDEQD
ncbi:MAG TPA: hypothetical protein VMG80_00480 [Solirubrobacteraceae bacterium]|nr:hypothetical protein [Solirubrobacteraceae bacterium]